MNCTACAATNTASIESTGNHISGDTLHTDSRAAEATSGRYERTIYDVSYHPKMSTSSVRCNQTPYLSAVLLSSDATARARCDSFPEFRHTSDR